MTHRPDPNRGIYQAACSFCEHYGPCRLVMHEDSYLWKCVGDCAPKAGG
jgi:hypothetical protein